MIAGADDAEAAARQLGEQPRQLPSRPADAAVYLGIQPAALFDAIEVGSIHVIPVRGETGAVVCAARDLIGGEIALIAGRVGQAPAHDVEELRDGPLRRLIAVECHQGHAAVDGGARQRRADGLAGGDGDARRHLDVVLVMKVGKHHRRRGEIHAVHALLQPFQEIRVRRRVGAFEHRRRPVLSVARRRYRRCGWRDEGHAHVERSTVSRTSCRRMSQCSGSATSRHASRRLSSADVSVTAGCAGPSPDAVARVAANAQ